MKKNNAFNTFFCSNNDSEFKVNYNPRKFKLHHY